MTNNPVTFRFQIELEFVFEERKKPKNLENHFSEQGKTF